MHGYTQPSRVRTRHARADACMARTVGLAPLRRTLTVSGWRTNPGTWTAPTEPYVASQPAYGSRLCDSFSTAEHHFPPRNKSGIYAFPWMGLPDGVLGVLDFFCWSLIVSWAPGVCYGGKGFEDFCLCSSLMLHAMRSPLLPPGPVSDRPSWSSKGFSGPVRNIKVTHLHPAHQNKKK